MIDEAIFNKERLYTIKSLSDFLNERSEERDWDTYTSNSLKTSVFNEMRKMAWNVSLPLDSEGYVDLRNLLAAAEASYWKEG